ncbi:MAG: hypothetical protein KDA92_12125, partial [Planctomycetales bacterium]|nr:hypothetical protein [Planctomycetales bacterium]
MDTTAFSSRESAFVEFVLRYGMGTNRTFRSRILTGRTLNAVSKVTARMVRDEVLSRHDFLPPEVCFRLGAGAARVLGLPSRVTQPLGPQRLPVDFATLEYATQGSPARRRLSATDIEDYLPWMPEELRQSPYCLDATGRLELIRVDLGGSPQHIARKVANAAHARLSVPKIAELAARSLFHVVVLTSTGEKATQIAKVMADADF